MNTDFTIFFDSEDTDPEEAAGAAQEAFKRLEHIEDLLSRFKASSDISRVNALKPSETWELCPESFACLNTAAILAEETNRAFDPSAGALIDFWKARTVRPEGCEQTPEWKAAWERHRAGEFALDPESRLVQCVSTGSLLDLGAIGKGFALDEMARRIEEDWELSRVLLSAGGSTVLALDAPLLKPGWKIGFGGETRLPYLYLTRRALSTSGTDNQPAHLVDPRTGLLVTRSDLVRAEAATAADADTLSTAFFVMSRAEAEEYCERRTDHCALFSQASAGDGVQDKFDVVGCSERLLWEDREPEEAEPEPEPETPETAPAPESEPEELEND
ncbi:MAG: FAD:protein FMN transferase [Puniceicoccales bacterium]|nr:FAD:protein FMN transferase [Puniceicoccales bacterium]